MSEEIPSVNYMENIPIEILFKILLPLSYYDIRKFCRGSKRLNDDICRNQHFWSMKSRQDFGDSSPTSIQEYMSVAEKILGVNYCLEKSLQNGDVNYINYLITKKLIPISEVINRVCRGYASKELIVYLMENHLISLTNDCIYRFLTTRVISTNPDLFRSLYSLVSNIYPITINLGQYFITRQDSIITSIILKETNSLTLINIYYSITLDRFRESEIINNTEFLMDLLEVLNIPFNPEIILKHGLELSSLSIINQAIKYGAHQFLKDLKDIQLRHFVHPDIISYVKDLSDVYTQKKKQLNSEILKALERGDDYFAEAIYYMFKHVTQQINGYNLVLFLSRRLGTENFTKIPPADLNFIRERPTIIDKSIEYFQKKGREDFVSDITIFANKYNFPFRIKE